MPDNLKVIAEEAAKCLPFMAAASNGGQQVNMNRMLEAVIIAAIIGAGTYFMMIPEIRAEFNGMKKEVHEISTDLKTVKADVIQLKIDVAVDQARHDRDGD